MSEYIPKLMSIAILDFHREKESDRLLTSLKEHLKVPADGLAGNSFYTQLV